jgi:hypothetical protein
MRRPTVVDAMLLATVLLWALNFTATKYVLTHGFRPLAYSIVRYGMASAIFGGLTFARERSFRVRGRDAMLLLGGAAVVLWLNQLGYVYSVKLTTASTVALILGSTPVFAALLGSVVVDLRDARFGSGVTEIDIRAALGSVELFVPPTVRVEMRGGASFLASVETDGWARTVPPGPSQPVLRVTSRAFMASVEVRVCAPGDDMLTKFEAALLTARRLPGRQRE